MSPTDWLFDLVLAFSLPLLAWKVVSSREVAHGVVLFIALGLACALAWARLEADDVALVEVAVGAGLTGALLMSALGHRQDDPRHSAPCSPWPGVLALVSGSALFPLALVELGEEPSGGSRPAVDGAMVAHEVSHPVTAVLLDFRGYDTLLEVMVLLVAALGVSALSGDVRPRATERDDALLDGFVNLLVPISIVVAGHLLARGTHAPGGAFQAAAVLAGAGLLLVLTHRFRSPSPASHLVRGALLSGPLLFLGVAVSPLVVGGPLLAYPRGWVSTTIFAVECALTIAIAVKLVMLLPPTREVDAGEGDAP